MEPYVQPASQHLDIIIIIFHFQAGPQEIRAGMYWDGIVGGMVSYVDAFEEAGLLRELVGVLDYVDSTLAAVERCRPPSVIARTLVYDGLKMLDDFAREYRGYVGKAMDYVCEELRSLLYEALGGE
jgi:hypothetical protein